jgi:hypothetical protein
MGLFHSHWFSSLRQTCLANTSFFHTRPQKIRLSFFRSIIAQTTILCVSLNKTRQNNNNSFDEAEGDANSHGATSDSSNN